MLEELLSDLFYGDYLNAYRLIIMNTRHTAPRVLHVITGLDQGGAERQLCCLLSTAMHAEHSAVFSLKEPGVMAEKLRQSGVLLFSGGGQRSLSLNWMPALKRAVMSWKPDLIIGWMYHGNLAASLTRQLGYRGPVIWNVRHSVHDLRLEKLSTRMIIRTGAWLSNCPKRILYNSCIAAEQHEAIGYRKGGRAVLPNGFDVDHFRPDSGSRNAVRSDLGVDDDEILLGVVGRAHPMKNHLGWVSAMKQLLASGVRVHSIMMGAGVDDPEGPVARAVLDAGLQKHITLLPPTDKPERTYPAMDILVMPSLWGEGFPNVVGEAMASGVPALVTNVGDSASIVGETGFVVSNGDPDMLAGRAREAIALGRPRLRALGVEARERIVTKYDLSSLADRYHSLFQEVLKGINN